MTEVAKFMGRILVGKHVAMRISQKEGVHTPLWLAEVVLGVRRVAPEGAGESTSPLGSDDVWPTCYAWTCPTS